MNETAHFNQGYVGAQRCLEILFPDPETGICLRTFKTLQLAGYIPHLKIGRRVLFRPSEVLAALEKRCKRRATH